MGTLKRTLQAAGLPGGRELSDFDLRVQFMVRQLVAGLRAQAGINVRLPSHHASPFRAVQFLDTYSQADPAATPQSVFLGLSGRFAGNAAPTAADPVPEGFRGVINRVKVYAFQNTNTALTTSTSWLTHTVSLRKNDQPLPGYIDMRAGGGIGLIVPPAVGNERYVQYAHIDYDACVVPINLSPGDYMQAVFSNSDPANSEHRFALIVGGYLYPIERDEDSIAGTLVD